MKKEFGEYYLGLDIGTDSVGWAVTDLDYRILKLNNKALWGIRLFENANTAAERRIFRTGRRRLERRNERIEILQDFFASAICEKDPGFFMRMKESRFWAEDKSENQINALFNDSDYSDKEYHMDYPTIYHLRRAIIENDKEYDVRLVYLAIHNIIKHRGHFLFEGQNIDASDSFEVLLDGLKDYIHSVFPEEVEFECKDVSEVEHIIKDRSLGVTAKKQALNNAFSASEKLEKDILALMAGGKVKLSAIFGEESLDSEEVSAIQFSDNGYEDKIPVLESELGDKIYLIEKLKAVYDWGILADMLQGEAYAIKNSRDGEDSQKNFLQKSWLLTMKMANTEA